MSMEKTLLYTTKCECSSLGVGMAKLWKWVPSSVVELACRFCNNISTNLYKKGKKVSTPIFKNKIVIKAVFVLGENHFRKSFSPKPACLAITENDIFWKMTSS